MKTKCLPRMPSDPSQCVEVGNGYWSMCGRGTSREETAKSATGDQLVAEEELVSKHVQSCVLAKF